MHIKVYNTIKEIESQEWKHFISKRFFLSYKYLNSLEESCPDLEYRYTVLFNANNEIEGVAYFQIADFKGRSLYEYLPKENKFSSKILKFGLNRIDTKLLTLGNIIFTCENGHKFSDAISEEQRISLLSNMIDETIKTMPQKPLGTMVSEELSTKNRDFFKKLGYHIFRVEDKMEMCIQPNFTFHQYKDALLSKYRVRMKKIYQLNSSTEMVDIDSQNFEEYNKEINQLFKQVTDKSKFKLVDITSNYFKSFLAKCPEKFKVLGFKQENKLIGFISYFYLENIIEIHYVGIDYKYNETHKIYNFMLYKMLEIGFEKDYKLICMSRTAQEIKSTLGATPVKVFGYLKINNLFFNTIVSFFLSKIVPAPWIQRHPYKIAS